jgi:hypothetical protein
MTRGARHCRPQLAWQALGSALIKPAVDRHVERDAVLIGRAPEPGLRAGDLEDDRSRCPVSPARGSLRRVRLANAWPNFIAHCRKLPSRFTRDDLSSDRPPFGLIAVEQDLRRCTLDEEREFPGEIVGVLDIGVRLVFDGSVDSRMAYTIIDKQQVIDTALDREVIAVAPEPAAMPPAAKPRTRYVVNQYVGRVPQPEDDYPF